MSKNYLNQNKVLFAVYGTLKENRSNHGVLGNAVKLGNCKTSPSYTLFDGGFPIVERDGSTPITIEVFETSDEKTINRVFSLEGCTGIKGHPENWYDFDEIETPFGKAVLFVMNKNKSQRLNIIENGTW